MTWVFTVGGFPCRIEQMLSWTLYTGAEARIYPFALNVDDAEALLKITKPITIEMMGTNGKKDTFENLYVVGEGAASIPFHRVVKVADSRWFWQKNHIRAQYNTPRVNTDRRIVSRPGTPIEVAQIVADVAFAQVSLKRPPGAPIRTPGKPWKAREVLEDVLDRVAGKGKWKIRAKKFPQGLVQGFLVDDPGNGAVSKALSLCPGLTCFQDRKGKIIIDSLLPGAADKVIEKLGDPLVTGQVIKRVDLSATRAEKYSTLTTRELGIRFDFIEQGSQTDEDPFLLNMGQVTMPELMINGKRVPINSWVKMDDLLPAAHLYFLAEAAAQGLVLLTATLTRYPINHDSVRKFFPSRLELIYSMTTAPDGTTYQPMARFIGMLRRCYRQVFMVNPAYSDAAIKFIAKNPGFIDPETGAEQAPPVYLDYSVQPTSLGIRNDPKAKFMVYNMDNAVAAGASLSTASVSPAVLTMLSDQLALFDIALRTDVIGERAQVFPGKCVGPDGTANDDDLPTSNHRKKVATIDKVSLKTGHQMNVILCIIPGFPNSDATLHRVTVKVTEVEAKYGIKIGAARPGLEFEQRLREGVTTAQYPYDQNKTEDVKKALGVVPGDPDLGDPINAPALKELTLASAFAYYMGKMDHYAGTQAIPLRDDIEPVGEIVEVQQTLLPGGAMQTFVTCQLWDFESFDPMALLPQSARRTLQRAINPAGA